MRRALLLAGIAAGAVALFTTVSYTYYQNQQTHSVVAFKTKLADLTYCRTGYDIASSMPHYQSRFAESSAEKIDLLKKSDELLARKDHLDRLLDQHIAKAKDLPVFDPATLVKEVQWKAELAVVNTAGWVEEPKDFLDHLDLRCEPYIN